MKYLLILLFIIPVSLLMLPDANYFQHREVNEVLRYFENN